MARPSAAGAVVRKDTWVIMARPLQEDVQRQLFQQWHEGQAYERKITANTDSQRWRQRKGYFKTYCDKHFGGQLWCKMMIAGCQGAATHPGDLHSRGRDGALASVSL